MDNPAIIRYATPEDIKYLRLIQSNDGFEHVYYLNKDRLENLFKRGEVFLIAFIGEKPVGFGSIDFEIRARLHFLSVDISVKGKKVGASLMLRMLDECKQRGYKFAHTYVEVNTNKEDFLVKFGFKNIGIFKDRYGKGLDSSIWQKDL